MKQYLLSVYGDEAELAKIDNETMQQMFKDVDVFNKEIQDSGNWVWGGGLHPSSTATVVRAKDGEVLTTDGPYAETKEVLGGFWIIQANDLDEALAIGARGAAACQGPVEVRPFQDVVDA